MSATKSGIKLLPFHPLVDLFPPLTNQEFDDLVADIDKHGQRVEIDTWNGEIIDGKHRALACQRLGIEPRYRERRFESEIGARDYVVSLNFHHRHLSPENRRALIAAFADWSKSDRAIAAELKTNKNLVGKVRKTVEGRKGSATTVPDGTVEKKKATVPPGTVERRVGKDGKARKQPARKQKAAAKVEPKQSEPEAKRILYCSFCGKSQDEVRKLIAGPTVFICNECVAVSAGIISDEQCLRELLAEMSAATRRRAFVILRDEYGEDGEPKPKPPEAEAKAAETKPETTGGENPWVPPAPAAAADDYPDFPEALKRTPQDVAA
jgi:hypothetical protein